MAKIFLLEIASRKTAGEKIDKSENKSFVDRMIAGSLSNDVVERRTSTGSGLFALLSRDFEQFLGQIVSISVKTLSNTNLVASRHIKREKGSLPVDFAPSKTSLLNSLDYSAPMNIYTSRNTKPSILLVANFFKPTK